MSIVIFQQKSVIVGPNAGVAPSGAFGSSVTGGNDIIVCAFGNDNAANGPLTVVVSDGVNSYVLVKDKPSGGFGVGCQYAAIYRATNVTGGTITITVTYSGAYNSGQYSVLGFNAYEVSGLDDTSASDATTSGSASSGSPITAGSLTPSVTGDLIIVCGSGLSADGNAPNVGSGFTLDFAQFTADAPAGVNNAQATESQINGGTSPVVCAFGSLPATGAGYAAAAAAFKAAAGVSPIAADITGTATVTGSLSGGSALAAVISGTASVIAALSGSGALVANIFGTTVVSGTLLGSSALAAVILGTTLVTANLTAVIVPVPPITIVAGFAPCWYYDQQQAGLAIWVATGSINGVAYNGRAVSVPANSVTNISIGPNGQIIFGVGAGSYPVATVISGQVQTSGTPNTLPVFSSGILSIADVRPSGIFSFGS